MISSALFTCNDGKIGIDVAGDNGESLSLKSERATNCSEITQKCIELCVKAK